MDAAQGSASLRVTGATTREEEGAARALISQVYSERYGVSFTEGEPDPRHKLEPWPDRFVLGFVGSSVVAVAGVYERATYVERFGGVRRADVEEAVTRAGRPGAGRPVVEYTKLVIAPAWEGNGLGTMFLAVTHSRDFLAPRGGTTPIVLACAKLSVFGSIYLRAGITTRTLAPFPWYPSHESYRSANDPMESRFLIPELDLDPVVQRLGLPVSLSLVNDGDRRVA